MSNASLRRLLPQAQCLIPAASTRRDSALPLSRCADDDFDPEVDCQVEQRPAVVRACLLHEPFCASTKWGKAREGNTGDWVAFGSWGLALCGSPPEVPQERPLRRLSRTHAARSQVPNDPRCCSKGKLPANAAHAPPPSPQCATAGPALKLPHRMRRAPSQMFTALGMTECEASPASARERPLWGAEATPACRGTTVPVSPTKTRFPAVGGPTVNALSSSEPEQVAASGSIDRQRRWAFLASPHSAAVCLVFFASRLLSAPECIGPRASVPLVSQPLPAFAPQQEPSSATYYGFDNQFCNYFTPLQEATAEVWRA